MKALVLDQFNQPLAWINDEEVGNARAIKLAGAVTINGDPVNVREHKITRNKRVMERAEQKVFEIITEKVKGAFMLNHQFDLFC